MRANECISLTQDFGRNSSRGHLANPCETQNVPERVNILGVNVSAINMTMALETIGQWIRKREHHYVCITGVHGVIESQSDSRLREIHNQAGLVTPDGMPLVWVSRLKGFRQVHRVYGPDLMYEFCRMASATEYRHFLYGGAIGVPERLADRLRDQFPGIRVVGTYSPPFYQLSAEEDEEVVRMINDSKADVVWVGLSTPKQEYWMAAHLERLNAPVMLGVGAAFDFLSGIKKQAPRWMRRSGLEWFYRLITEPRRLWRRYLTIIPLFVFHMALEILGFRDREEDVRNSA